MAAVRDLGGSLTPSAEAALRWAGAVAALRAGEPPSPPPIAPLDLLVGVALAHDPARDASPALDLLGHFKVPLGALLPPADRALLSGPALERALADVPVTGPPGPLEADLEGILERAESEWAVADGRVPLAGLLAALVSGTTENDAMAAVRAALRRAGADPGPALAALAEFVRAGDEVRRPGLGAFLSERYRWPPDLRLAPYASDRPEEPAGAREAADPLGLDADVEAFARLIAATTLAPPLAIGLFGDWGAGKSFFMNRLKRRIADLAEERRASDAPTAAAPFHRNVVQIDFNAWHYVDGDLWASLLDQIFTSLGQDPADTDPGRRAVRELEQRILRRISRTAAERVAARERLARARASLEAAEAALRERAAEQRRVREEAERDRADLMRERVSDETRTVLVEALRKAGQVVTPGTAPTIEAALHDLGDARATLARGGLRTLLRRPDHLPWRVSVAFGVAVVVPPVVAALVHLGPFGGAADVLAGISAVAVGAAATVREGAASLREADEALGRAERQVENELRRRRDDVDRRLREADAAVRSWRDSVANTRAAVRRADADLERMRAELGGLRSEALREFLAERLGSDDYRSRLGVPALVRRDLEMLSSLIEQNNRDVLERGPGPQDRLVNRIVLYVDDLDRCPADRVVLVLQAVHLLLAFPAFVVVAAVDTRWLEGSLRRQYAGLLDGARPRAPDPATPPTRAAPSDYIEKIFQVPFRVPRLDEPGTQALLHGLLDARVEAVAAPADHPAGAGAAMAAPAAAVASLADGRVPRAESEVARDLTVTRDEMRFLDRLAPLLASTPRAVKRFVNLYLLVKARAGAGGRPFGVLGATADHEVVMLLLTLAVGLPELARSVLAEAQRIPASTGTLESVAAGDGDEAARLRAWLASNEGWGSRPLATMDERAREVARFTFAA